MQLLEWNILNDKFLNESCKKHEIDKGKHARSKNLEKKHEKYPPKKIEKRVLKLFYIFFCHRVVIGASPWQLIKGHHPQGFKFISL